MNGSNGWMDSMNKCINRTNEYINEYIEWRNELMNQWKNQPVNQWMTQPIKWMNEIMNWPKIIEWMK